MFDIDMKNLSGEDFGPVAADQVVDTNSYSQETSEYPVQKELLDQPVKEEKAAPEQVNNPQAENFRAFREEVDRMKAEREAEKREFQLQLEMMRANNAQNQQPPKPERKFLDGMDENDIPSVSDLRKEWSEREAAYTSRIEELQVAQQHPDYAEVIEKYAVPLVQQKPHLAEGLMGARNKALFAYELGKMAQQMQQSTPAIPQKSETAQRIVENSKKPGTLSQAGGQGALSKADYFASMSDQEFMRMATKNLEGI